MIYIISIKKIFSLEWWRLNRCWICTWKSKNCIIIITHLHIHVSSSTPSIINRSICRLLSRNVPGRPSRAKHVKDTSSRAFAARSTVAKFIRVWSISLISDSATRQKGARLEVPRWHSRTPAPPPDRGPQIYHRAGLYPHQISSRRRRSRVPSYVIPALRQLIYLWAGISLFSPRPLALSLFPSLAHSSSRDLCALPPLAKNNSPDFTFERQRMSVQFSLCDSWRNIVPMQTCTRDYITLT